MFQYRKWLSVSYEHPYLYVSQAIASKIDLQGNVTFYDNTVEGSFGGALYLLSSSQVVLQDNTHVMFANNNGRYVCCLEIIVTLY